MSNDNEKENRVRALFSQWKIQIERKRQLEKQGMDTSMTNVFGQFAFEIEDLERQLWGLGYGINEDDKLVAI